MNKTFLAYLDRQSVIHHLTGVSKLLCFLLWSIAVMVTYDTRVIVFLFCCALAVFRLSKITWKDVRPVACMMFFFVTLNAAAIFLFSPLEGVKIYGSRQDLAHIVGHYWITKEQLFYEFNVTMKYFTVFPIAVIFLMTTEPSEFAASLNRLGVSYQISYAVSLTLRYIPEIQKKYQEVALSQQARGIDISSKEKFIKRIRNMIRICMPLIFTSLSRIETIGNAMELRRFGKYAKRTWYNGRQFEKKDFIAVAVMFCVFVGSIVFTFWDGSRFYNPFE